MGVNLLPNQIICGDNVEILKTFSDDVIDLTVTSPPYDDMREYEGGNFDFKSLAKELYRVTKPGGQVVWIVGDQTKDYDESGTSFEQALYFKKKCGFKLNDTMIYERNATPGKFPRYPQQFEYMFILCKGKPKTIHLQKYQKTSYYRSVSIHRKRDGSFIRDGHYSSNTVLWKNIWKYTVGLYHSTHDKFAFTHPAIFPEQLASDHIKSWSNKGDLILDPFCGSGTTLKMAKLLGRDYIGIDVSQKYCDMSKQRVSQEPIL